MQEFSVPPVRDDSSPPPRHPYFDSPFVALAHRGGALLPANLGKENTLAAFANAVQLGYRYLETDLHATADGMLVAFHDSVLDRVTDETGRIGELPYARVRRARIGGSEPIPTLAEVFDAFDARLNIDLKADAAVAPLAAAIRRHGAADRVCVGSFSSSRLRAFRRLAGPSVATSAGPLAVARNAFAPLAPRRDPDAGYAYQVPVSHTWRGIRVPVITPRFVARAHAAGRQVHAWTIDDPDEMGRLIDLGVDGLVSDRIDTLRDVLVERGLW